MRIGARVAAGLIAVVLACVSQAAGGKPPRAKPPPVVLAAGDIAACNPATVTTGALIQRTAGTVATLGDHAYPVGSREDFARCYDPFWGMFKARTRPAPGNHDYETPGAAGYFEYFGTRAGPPGRGYYGYRLGNWTIVSLNSNCEQIGGCAQGSAEERWLRAYLRAHPTRCTLAYWHHPRFSTGEHGDDQAVIPLWRDLYAAGADVIVNGHDHNYQRFPPLTPDGQLDLAHGVRQFVVGTGGASLTSFPGPAGVTEARTDESYGVLRLVLRRRNYSWQFVAESQSAFRDAGTSPCHTRP